MCSSHVTQCSHEPPLKPNHFWFNSTSIMYSHFFFFFFFFFLLHRIKLFPNSEGIREYWFYIGLCIETVFFFFCFWHSEALELWENSRQKEKCSWDFNTGCPREWGSQHHTGRPGVSVLWCSPMQPSHTPWPLHTVNCQSFTQIW